MYKKRRNFWRIFFLTRDISQRPFSTFFFFFSTGISGTVPRRFLLQTVSNATTPTRHHYHHYPHLITRTPTPIPTCLLSPTLLIYWSLPLCTFFRITEFSTFFFFSRSGTIADREHRKWTEQAIALQNNPYSRESIERRLSRGVLIENLSPTRATSKWAKLE
jgi:hypothetical protein